MGNLAKPETLNDLHGKNTQAERDAVARLVASRAADDDDRQMLLDMFGLNTTQGDQT